MAEPVAADSSERVTLFSHAVSKKDLKPGDHIYVNRKAGLYHHHGIYIGEKDCEVIHFTAGESGSKSSAMLQKGTVEQFCDGRQLRLVSYGENIVTHLVKRPGSSHSFPSDPADEVIKRAEYYLSNPDEWRKYNLLFNNCESFAFYCKTGLLKSAQVTGSDLGDRVGLQARKLIDGAST